MKYLKSTFLIFFTLFGISFLFNNIDKVNALNIYGCNPDSTRLNEVSTTSNFQAYLNQIGVPYTKYITKAGKYLSVNYDYAVNDCLIVYGTPNDVVPDGRKYQQWSNGQPLYYGYTQLGNEYPNPDYPDYVPQINYFNIHPFTYDPWSDSGLQSAIAASSSMPFTTSPSQIQPTYYDPELKRVRTAQEELDRAYDRMYLENCGTNCSLGNRGYFPQVNTALNKTLVGSNLYYYASVDAFPDKYAAGIFTMYYKSPTTGKYWYASTYLPPYELFLQEKRDLSVTINSISPSSVMEGTNYTVNYTVCNVGQFPVTNPVITYGDTSSETGGSQTLSTTLKETDCYTGNISQLAEHVTADTPETFYMTVNKDGTNPEDEDITSNNTDTKGFTIQHRVIDYSAGITSWTPTAPNSNQQFDVTYKICNNGNVTVSNVNWQLIVKYGGNAVQTINKSSSTMAAGACQTYTDTLTAPDIKNYTDSTPSFQILITSGPYLSEDINTSNNQDTAAFTVRNPDALVDISAENDGSNTTIGDAKVKVVNNTWGTITQDCSTSSLGCLSGTTKTTYNIYVYDTKFTSDTSDDVLVAHYTPSFNLSSFGANNTYDIGRTVFTAWVQNHYPNTYQLIQFRVVAQIPEYTGEVDWDGNPSYTNNYNEKILNYFPTVTNISSASQCNEIQSTITSYFTTPDGFNPIKMCAGQYPTYPSTSVESGMQAYNYVMYRFFPEPIPRYTVSTPVTDVTNPNHFYQSYQLPPSENYNQMGDINSMFFPNNLSNGYYQERGRYMPTGGTFNFQVYKKNTDGSKGQQIALGTVSYNIPSTCYDSDNLDIKHQYACDEILFYLPNPDNNQKFSKPSNDTSSPVTYPISNTRIPYLNPGKYTFQFDANENFHYYYQTNQTNTGYRWSNPKFK